MTPESRLDLVNSGEIDLECGSTTNNAERHKVVAFLSTIFVTGTKLLVRRLNFAAIALPRARTLAVQVDQFDRAVIENVLRRHHGSATA